MPSVGDIMCNFAPPLKLYEKYVRHFERASTYLTEKQQTVCPSTPSSPPSTFHPFLLSHPLSSPPSALLPSAPLDIPPASSESDGEEAWLTGCVQSKALEEFLSRTMEQNPGLLSLHSCAPLRVPRARGEFGEGATERRRGRVFGV